MSLWTITNPGGSGTVTIASLNLSEPVIDFRVMGISKAQMTAQRVLSSTAPWWAFDAEVTIYRDGDPYFTGRVQESPDGASGRSATRTLLLADAWKDFEEVIYREPWSIGTGSYLYPRCIVGMDSGGELISSGKQIEEVIDYLISQGVNITKGVIDAGFTLWPSEVRNQSCEAIITGEMRFHPDWVAWLDHSTPAPTFHARAKANLDTVTVDVEEERVFQRDFVEVKRNVPLGVSIIYESANLIDGETFRNAYPDEVGATTGRRVMRAMLDLEGLNVPFQKSRVETRNLPTSEGTMAGWLKAKYPELIGIPDANLQFTNFSSELAAEGTQPPPVNPKALRIAVSTVADVPRELVSGSIEDWMRVKVRRVIVKYDLKISEVGLDEDQKKLAKNFSGEGKSISVVGTSAVTRIYKGISSFTEGEGRPVGLAAALFAAATVPQYEGVVGVVDDDLPEGRWHGKVLVLKKGLTTLMPGAVIHAATATPQDGRVTMSFGPMPYLTAGDFLELQRMFNRRPVTWMSPQERTANTLGATDHGGSRGDNVSGYHMPDTVTPPGGGGGAATVLPFALSVSKMMSDYKWVVSSVYSTITDGTNGDLLDISDLDTETTFTGTKWIVAEGIVSDLEVGTIVITAVDTPEEVSMSGTPEAQDKVRLLIGKVSVVEDAPVAEQFLFEAARLTYGFLNGKLVRVFELAPVHQSYAPPVPPEEPPPEE